MSGSDLELVDIDQAKVLQALGLNITDPKAQATLLICRHYDLDPFLGQMQLVQGKPYITRDGYLHIAHRSKVFDGMEILEDGENDRGWFCKVAVYRKDMSRPFTAVGRVKKGEKTQVDPWDMALTRAERRALRRAFDVAGVVDVDVDELGGFDPVAAEAGPEPFDVTTTEQPALPAATSTKQAAKKRLVDHAQALKDNDPVSQIEVDELLARVGGFDAEHKAMAAAQMKGYGLTLKHTPTRQQARSIVQVLDSVEAFQADAFEQRRKAVMVSFAQIYPEGVSDDDRHRIIRVATADVSDDDGGATESMKRLTEAQSIAVLDYIDRLASDERATKEAS